MVATVATLTSVIALTATPTLILVSHYELMPRNRLCCLHDAGPSRRIPVSTLEYVYKISEYAPSMSARIVEILPPNFSIQQEGQDHLLTAKYSRSAESSKEAPQDQAILCDVQRECDRIYFLTGLNMNPVLIHKNGLWESTQNIGLHLHVIANIASDIDRQDWKDGIALQLRLWNLANSPNQPVNVQINLLFQIIETSYPDTKDSKFYPQYKDSSISPHPRTEAKFLRHLVSHQGTIKNGQLKLYCNHIGIPVGFYDPTDVHVHQAIVSRLSVIQQEAKRIIDNSITRKMP